MAVGTRVFDRRSILGGLAGGFAASLVRLDAVAAAESAPLVLAAGPGKLALVPQAETAVLAFNGQVPGPLLRLKPGAAVDVRLDNRLDRPTTISWHGVRLPEGMDGVAGLTQVAVQPGGSFAYRFVPPDSGLYWYHPEVWPGSAALVGRGLYGVLIVDEASPPPVDADLLVVIDDWMLGPDGQVLPDQLGLANPKPLLTVNSKPLPMTQDVRPGARVRLRLLNVCVSRLALVSCSGMPATVIAVDGQPSGLFEPARGTVPIGPGSRFELILDLPRDVGAAAGVELLTEGMPAQPLLRFALKGEALPPRGAVVKLPDNPLLPTRIHLENSLKRDLVIAEVGATMDESVAAKPPARQSAGPHAEVSSKVSPKVPAKPLTKPPTQPPIKAPGGNSVVTSIDPAAPLPAGSAKPLAWTMAGKPVDGLGGRPLFSVKRGSPVTLAFINRSAFAQQARIHGHVVRVLHDLDDGWDPYWRDGVLVGPGRTKHVAFVADNPGRWMVEAVALDRPGPSLAAFFTVDA